MKINWPWWASIIMAALCYLGLRFIVPAGAESVSWLRPVAPLATQLAPIVTIALLLLGGKQLYDQAGDASSPDNAAEAKQDNEGDGTG